MKSHEAVYMMSVIMRAMGEFLADDLKKISYHVGNNLQVVVKILSDKYPKDHFNLPFTLNGNLFWSDMGNIMISIKKHKGGQYSLLLTTKDERYLFNKLFCEKDTYKTTKDPVLINILRRLENAFGPKEEVKDTSYGKQLELFPASDIPPKLTPEYIKFKKAVNRLRREVKGG